MSILAFAPPVLDGLLAQQNPAFGPPYFFSRSFAANPAKVHYVTALYREDTLANVRRLALANYDNVYQFLFVFERKVYVFTHPSVGTNSTNRPIMLGSLSDSVWTNIPASIRLQSYEGFTTSLIPAAAVDMYHLPRGALLPDTIQGATTPAGVNEPGSFARLDFGLDAPTILPTFAAVPVMLAVPLGVHLPAGPWSLEVPQPELEAIYPFYEVWRAAHMYNAKNNEGFSVTMGGPLFDHAAFAGNNMFPDTFPIRMTSDATFAMIFLNSPHFSEVADMVAAISQAAMVRVVAALGPAAPPIAPPAPEEIDVEANAVAAAAQRRQHEGDRMFQLMEQNMNKGTATQAEKEHKLAADIVCAKFSLAFANLVPSDDGLSEPTVVPATIRPDFRAILEATKLTTATRLMRDEVDIAVRRAASSDNRFDGQVNMTGEFVDGVVLACLRDFRFLAHSMDSEPQLVKSWLSLMALVSPGSNLITFKQRFNQGNTQAIQEAVGEAPAKMDRKSTELYIGGSLNCGEDTIATLANWRVLGNIITDDYDVSEMRKGLWCFAKNFYSAPGQLWLRRIAATPQVPLNLLIAAQDIIAAYFLIAMVPEYRDAVMGGAPVHPDPFMEANVLAKGVANDLYTAVVRNTLLLYSHIPLVSTVLPHLRLSVTPHHPIVFNDINPPVAAGYHEQAFFGGGGKFPHQPVRAAPQQQGGGFGGGGRGGGAGRGAYPGRDNNNRAGVAPFARAIQQEDARAANGKHHGFLTYSMMGGGPRTPPVCDVSVKLANMPSRERVCILFATKGYFCPHGDKCKQAHIPAFHRVPQAVQALIRGFVERTPGLAFVPNLNPPGARV